MIVFKLYKYSNLKAPHIAYFNGLLETVRQNNFLSPSIDEIIITDDIEGEINRYCSTQVFQPNLTRNREYIGIAKTVNFEGTNKIFFDFINVNGYIKYTPQIFFEQLLRIYAEDIVSLNYKVPKKYSTDTLFPETIKIYFSHWATEVVANSAANLLAFDQVNIHPDVKMFVDAFKRKIRKLHYEFQDILSDTNFWISSITEVDQFIRRCLDVKFDNGSFSNLQEFIEIIPPLLLEIETQTHNLLKNEEVVLTSINKYILGILNICSIDIPNQGKMEIKIVDSPKKLFKNNIVDTEPRIVAFIDILGFSAIIEEFESDKTSNILNELHDALEIAIKVSIENITDIKTKTDLKEYLEFRMFSDCICLSLPYIEFGNDFHIQFQSLTSVVKAYQIAMMQRGFFVRGGITIGSYFSNQHMIFSGGLVSAHKLEKEAVYPIIAVDKKVIDRLKVNYTENTKELFYENILLFSESDPDKIFLNPFDLLDNSLKYFDYIQSTLESLIKENEENKEDSLSKLTSSLVKLTNTYTKPIFDFTKSQLTPENMHSAKETVLEHINVQLEKFNEVILKSEINSDEYNNAKRINLKYEYIKSLTEWSMGKADTSLFKYFKFT